MELIWIIPIVCGAVNSYEISNNHDALMYLNRFGYINDEDVTDNSDMSNMKPMLMEFQKMCNIKQSGVLDSKTMNMMNAPRCGNLDINQTEHHTMFLNELDKENYVSPERYRRFTINENKFRWKKRELTYKMGMFSQNMGAHVSREIVLKELHHAFKLWSEVTNLDFIYRPDDKKVDIELSFTMRFHIQDQFPFDGPGKTLAHAFPPGEGVLGDVHFEDEERWTVNSPKGINVLFVATHEIGHALGLSHSKVKGAIMQPFYGGYQPKLQLHPDDIEGIQSLYGKRVSREKPVTQKSITGNQGQKQPKDISTPSPTPRSQKSPSISTTTTTERNIEVGSKPVFMRPDLCKDSKIDAITTLFDGTVYAFKDEYAFQIDGKGKGIVPGWPHHIGTVFEGLVGSLDAAVTRDNGKTYFFKGAYYWRFTKTKMDSGYPKKISANFRGIPDNVDSAFEWLKAIYFTKGDKIWRFDPSSKPFVSDKYPIPLSLWELGNSVPRIDASFKAPNGHIYFFYDQLYWRFDEKKFKINNDLNPSYPRSSKIMWFGCTGGAPIDYRNVRQPEAYRYSAYYDDQTYYDEY